MSENNKKRWIVENADKKRAALAVSPSKLAKQAGCAPVSVKDVLAGVPKTKYVCEKVVAGLQALGCKDIDQSSIVKV